MNRTLIIAEAGVNHNGDLTKAKQLIEKAAEAKADYVKFQSFKAKNLVSKSADLASYQKDNTNFANQYEMLKSLELGFTELKELAMHAKEYNIGLLSSPFDIESVDMLCKLGQDYLKIPSGEITNHPLLAHIAGQNTPVIISTGMSYLEEISEAINVLVENGLNKSQLSILQCNTQYPTPMKDINLNVMNTLKEEFGCKVGYSDHSLGIEIPIAAVAKGATIIEKHFTLDKSLPGPDHKASLNPKELRDMIKAIRNVELALGHSEKKPTSSEVENRRVARKSIHFASNLNQGETLKIEHLSIKRPGDGIAPKDINNLIGKTLTSAVFEDQKVEWNHVQ